MIEATLQQAVFAPVANDGGLYMPDNLPKIPKAFFNNLSAMTMPEIGYVVANTLFGEDIDSRSLKEIIDYTFSFDIPIIQLEENIYVMELFHGPTLAINDVSARFMSRLVQYLSKKQAANKEIKILVATTGDTGSAIANAFYDVKGVTTYILYPKDAINRLRTAQFTSLRGNVRPIEVAGSYTDCQQLVNQALNDKELASHSIVTSGNSINIARFIPQMFYCFFAYARMLDMLGAEKVNNHLVYSVPRGNLGNICSAIIAKRMGLPIKRLVAAAIEGDSFINYSGVRKLTSDPNMQSNQARLLNLSENNKQQMTEILSSYTFDDKKIAETIADIDKRNGYTMSPKSAKAYLGLKETLKGNEIGVFIAPTHPVKFLDLVEKAVGHAVEIPAQISQVMIGANNSKQIPATYSALKRYLMTGK